MIPSIGGKAPVTETPSSETSVLKTDLQRFVEFNKALLFGGMEGTPGEQMGTYKAMLGDFMKHGTFQAIIAKKVEVVATRVELVMPSKLAVSFASPAAEDKAKLIVFYGKLLSTALSRLSPGNKVELVEECKALILSSAKLGTFLKVLMGHEIMDAQNTLTNAIEAKLTEFENGSDAKLSKEAKDIRECVIKSAYDAASESIKNSSIPTPTKVILNGILTKKASGFSEQMNNIVTAALAERILGISEIKVIGSVLGEFFIKPKPNFFKAHAKQMKIVFEAKTPAELNKRLHLENVFLMGSRPSA